MAMDARKQRILEAIVALYANDGEPVGSGLLANYFDMALSSATLRNEMAALTKLGLLEQPHTSAGRVPSAQGYRYYLDHLIDAPKSGTGFRFGIAATWAKPPCAAASVPVRTVSL